MLYKLLFDELLYMYTLYMLSTIQCLGFTCQIHCSSRMKGLILMALYNIRYCINVMSFTCIYMYLHVVCMYNVHVPVYCV